MIERTRRRSRACRQFEQLPNLTARLVGAEDTDVRGVLRYAVRVANNGHRAGRGRGACASRSTAAWSTPSRSNGSSPARTRLLVFRGPECDLTVSAAADPDGLIAESSEDDNTQALSCAELPQR